MATKKKLIELEITVIIPDEDADAELEPTPIKVLDLPGRAHNRLCLWWYKMHLGSEIVDAPDEAIAMVPRGPHVEDLLVVVQEDRQHEWLRISGFGRMSVYSVENALLKFRNGTS